MDEAKPQANLNITITLKAKPCTTLDWVLHGNN